MSGGLNFRQLQGRASRISGMNPTPTYAPYPLTRRVRSLSHRHRWRCSLARERTLPLQPNCEPGAATAGTPGPFPWRLRQYNLNFY